MKNNVCNTSKFLYKEIWGDYPEIEKVKLCIVKTDMSSSTMFGSPSMILVTVEGKDYVLPMLEDISVHMDLEDPLKVQATFNYTEIEIKEVSVSEAKQKYDNRLKNTINKMKGLLNAHKSTDS